MAPDSDLSSAAEAVLNAVTLNRYDAPYYACIKSIGQIKSDVAAALRAAADQVAREPPHSEPDDPEMLKVIWHERRTIRAELLAIAAELENHD